MRTAAVGTLSCGALLVLPACGDDAPTSPSDATYVAVLTGSSARPPRTTPGTGRATFQLHGDALGYALEVSNLSAPVTVAHLQIGDRETIGGLPLVSFAIAAPTGTIATGTIDLSRPITFNTVTISGDSLRTLFARSALYVNVYTATNPTGEIRGQVVRE